MTLLSRAIFELHAGPPISSLPSLPFEECTLEPWPPQPPVRDIVKFDLACAIAQEEADRKGYVSTTDLVRAMGIAATTAGRYIDLLITAFGWTSEPMFDRPRGRGRPAKTAGPRKGAPDPYEELESYAPWVRYRLLLRRNRRLQIGPTAD